MSKLIYVESSPRKARSHSIAVAGAFLDAYAAAHPGDAVETWDLWAANERLPEFDGATLAAKYTVLGGGTPAGEEAEAWRRVEQAAARLKSADKLVLSVPMWNFGVPYKLKHLIDVVTQPGLTFGWDPAKGFFGLAPATAAVVISARGGSYAPGSPMAAWDGEAPYVERWLRFIGVGDVTHVYVDPTGGPPEAVAAVREKAVAEARALAARF